MIHVIQFVRSRKVIEPHPPGESFHMENPSMIQNPYSRPRNVVVADELVNEHHAAPDKTTGLTKLGALADVPPPPDLEGAIAAREESLTRSRDALTQVTDPPARQERRWRPRRHESPRGGRSADAARAATVVNVAEQTDHTLDEAAAMIEDARDPERERRIGGFTASIAYDLTSTAPRMLIEWPRQFRAYLLILAEWAGRAFYATKSQIAAVLGRSRAAARSTLRDLQKGGWLRRLDDGRWKLKKCDRYLRVPVNLALNQPARDTVIYALHRQRGHRKLKLLELHKRRRQIAPETLNSGTVSHRWLGQETGCSRRTVVRSHKRLNNAGWLRGRSRYRNGRRCANSYEIALWRRRPFLSSCSGRKRQSAPSGRSNDLRNRAVPAPISPGTWKAKVEKAAQRHRAARVKAGEPPSGCP